MMMTFGQLTAFHRSLSDEKVLTIYIDGTAADPAVQRAWRTQLENSLKDLRLWLDGSTHEERESFEKSVVALEQILSSVKTTFGSPGWVAFITDDGVIDRHELPVPVPTLAVWSTGPAI